MNYKVPDREAAMRPALCVFCGSNHGKDPAYTDVARRFGALMAQNGFDLVFGGGGVGLMGELARSVREHHAKVTGIIPDFLRHLEPPLQIASELIITRDMNERKSKMFAAADAFVVLPGGLGTLDELAEAMTGAQLRTHAKPIVFVNTKGFFDPLLDFFDHIIGHGFASPDIKNLTRVVATPEEAIALLRGSLRPSAAAGDAPAPPAQARAKHSQK